MIKIEYKDKYSCNGNGKKKSWEKKKYSKKKSFC